MISDPRPSPVPPEVQHTWQKFENRANRETYACYECGTWNNTADNTMVCVRKDRRGHALGRRADDLE